MIGDKKIFLLGFMGSGKSTLGKQLAKQLGIYFFDLDDEIENQEGCSVTQIFAKKGEDYFRILEQKILKDLITKSRCVIALGGGTPCFFDNMKLINQSGISIYIKYNANVLYSRLMKAKTLRPLIKNKSEQELKVYIENSLTEREEFYLKSNFVIEKDDITIKDLLAIFN